jgi:hypothetical protein
MSTNEHQTQALAAMLQDDAEEAWEQLQHLDRSELLALNVAAYHLSMLARDCRQELPTTARSAEPRS